jgi:hypothetical protein
MCIVHSGAMGIFPQGKIPLMKVLSIFVSKRLIAATKLYTKPLATIYKLNLNCMENKLKKSILTSYLIGAPIGILTIIATILLIMTGEGVVTLLVFEIYGISIVGLLIAFLFALWIGGKLAYQNIKSGKSLLLTSLKYSTIVNLIIWLTFCLIVGLTVTEDRFLMMIPPIIAFVTCTILTTFTIGLLIVYLIKRINNNPT